MTPRPPPNFSYTAPTAAFLHLLFFHPHPYLYKHSHHYSHPKWLHRRSPLFDILSLSTETTHQQPSQLNQSPLCYSPVAALSSPGPSAFDTTDNQLPWIPTPAARPQPLATSPQTSFSTECNDFVLYSDYQAGHRPLTNNPRSTPSAEHHVHQAAIDACNSASINSCSVNHPLDISSASAYFDQNHNNHSKNSNLALFRDRVDFLDMAKSMSCDSSSSSSSYRPNVSAIDDSMLFSDEPMEFTDMLTGDEGFGSLGSAAFKAVNSRAAAQPSAPSSYTVSPRELNMDHSAPNSNTFTNLTTPSMYDGSPDDLSSFEASPLFTNQTDGSHSSQWPSLFADEDNVLYAPAAEAPQPAAADMARSSSSTSTNSESTPAAVRAETARQRMSISAGVHKNKRTGRVLGPIEVDEADSAAIKRAKNTLAARKSRQKKRDVEDQLRMDLAEMTAQRDRWMHVAIAHGAPLPDPRDPKTP